LLHTTRILIDNYGAWVEGRLAGGGKEKCYTFVPTTNTEQAILGFKTGPCSVKLLSNHMEYGMALVHVT
jgi:hypothetical protein